MATIQLAVMFITLWAFLPSQARYCLSRCCNLEEVKRSGHQLVSRFSVPKYMPSSSEECRASSTGHVSERSTSPWTYEIDEDNTRFPRILWQARCNCPNCIVLRPLASGHHTSETDPLGNSAIIKYNTVVFFRRPCGENQFYLVPEVYTVNVSCTCVIPEKAS